MADLDLLRETIRNRSLNKAPAGEFFTLASGEKSTYFFDMKPTILEAKASAIIAQFILSNGGDFEYVGGMETGAIPIVGTVCALAGMRDIPLEGFFIRKKAKERGTRKLVEGNLGPGKVLMLEDVTTSGGSVLKAIEVVREEGGKVDKVITILDREAGARELLEKAGIELVAIFTKSDLGV